MMTPLEKLQAELQRREKPNMLIWVDEDMESNSNTYNSIKEWYDDKLRKDSKEYLIHRSNYT